MDSINNILSNRDYSEPAEIEKLKKYIWDNYKHQSTVAISGKSIVVGVSSSALLTSIRFRLPEIKKELRIDQPVRLKRNV